MREWNDTSTTPNLTRIKFKKQYESPIVCLWRQILQNVILCVEIFMPHGVRLIRAGTFQITKFVIILQNSRIEIEKSSSLINDHVTNELAWIVDQLKNYLRESELALLVLRVNWTKIVIRGWLKMAILVKFFILPNVIMFKSNRR